ncbi:Cytochrome c oxidase (B(O/a)3-type) chain I [Parageobacillus caldoxylosilyticus]|uniref:Uncharacterized protein n=2 Tax=Saccharococcus caldoxylosilyticus TaxID=81408 RepID=A0A023DJK7_9BACL|nr:Cytochrome c oxidase (B(O/a)3-type) chain I [Parageobacillus caldoxylosilyticus]BDG35773.1 hypothetical protein PcaKH15_16790 [Parageobacillus caldoxylosilyticus]BDG39555.1 hypothetical protein PcaKH16_16940 [Parageobacillus caldoxylosilyticus]BDG43328.1 hypothetical protein PcaKH35_16730 [Parageobacillus caldoxylosilyticus]GAJ41206.1 hypothetical protein GCA01S_060_00210 [Parageobacillus caldoxylosilyticus NBRC 107762]
MLPCSYSDFSSFSHGLPFISYSCIAYKFSDHVCFWGWIGFRAVTIGTVTTAFFILTEQVSVLEQLR